MRTRFTFTVLILVFAIARMSAQSSKLSAEEEQSLYNQLLEIKESTTPNPEANVELLQAIGKQFDLFSDSLKRDFLRKRGWSHFRNSSYDLALKDLLGSRALHVKTNDPAIGDIDMYLGHLYVAMDSLSLARNQYQQAASQFEIVKDSIGLILTNDGLANIWYNYEENNDSAIFYLKKALSYADADPEGTHISVPMSNYAMLLYEQDRTLEAITQLKKAMEYDRATKDSFNLIFSYANLGKFNIELDEKVGRQYLDTAFLIATKLEAKGMLRDLHEGVSEMEAYLGNYEKALSHYQDFHNYQSELINEDLIDRAKNWELTLENQKKDEEIRLQKARARNLIIIVATVLLFTGWIVHSNRQIRRVKKQLEQQNVELDALNATKDKFFSIIAHDLRSPMIGLQGVGQKLEYFIRKERPEKLLEMGSKIDQSIDQLNHLLNNLLNWATSQLGGVPHHPDQTDLGALVNENIKLYKSLAESKEVTVSSEIDSLSAHVDANAISTVIRNLLSNAIKFTPKGGKVLISGETVNEHTQVIISDEGEGMDEGKMSTLFTTDLKSSRGTSSEKGFGLGLKLCKEFVEKNEGRIEIQSRLGEGTTFSITLPAKARGLVRKMDVA